MANYYLIDGKYVPAKHELPKPQLVKEVARVEEVAKETQETQEAPAAKRTIKVSTLDGLTKVELKAYLTELGIEHNARASQRVLLDLLSPHVEFEAADL